MSSSKVLVQRESSAKGSARIPMSPSTGSIHSNPGHYINPGMNRQIADFGIQSKPMKNKNNNVGNNGIPSRKFYAAAG
jgi:hypothetical protein